MRHSQRPIETGQQRLPKLSRKPIETQSFDGVIGNTLVPSVGLNPLLGILLGLMEKTMPKLKEEKPSIVKALFGWETIWNFGPKSLLERNQCVLHASPRFIPSWWPYLKADIYTNGVGLT
jgi:hypothetical protein